MKRTVQQRKRTQVRSLKGAQPLYATSKESFLSGNLVHRNCNTCEQEEQVQRKDNGAAGMVSAGLSGYIHSLGGSGQALGASQQSFFSSRMGQSFHQVKIHTGQAAAQSARQINAKAYTHKNHIVFGEGQYQPETQEGRKLLAHELTHVVQQGGDGNGEGKIQRTFTNEPNGGCGICKDAPVVGTELHTLIQGSVGSRSIISEASFTYVNTIPGSPGDENGRLDLVRMIKTDSPPHVEIQIGEIKPNNTKGIRDGERDLMFYKRSLEAYCKSPHCEVTFMNTAKPTGLIYKDSPLTSSCPPQLVTVMGVMGLYLYSCQPTTKMVGGKACCAATVPPVPIPVPVKKDVKETNERRITAPDPKLVFAFAAAAALAFMAAAVKKMNPVSRVAGLAAIAYLLMSGKAKLSLAGSGSDPIEAMIKAMEQDGVEVPENLRKVIEDDPELKKMMEEAAKKGGDMTDLQKKVAKKMSQVISDNLDKFTEEELELLMVATENVKGADADADITVEKLKEAAARRKKGQTEGSSADPAKAGAKPGQPAAKDAPAADPAKQADPKGKTGGSGSKTDDPSKSGTGTKAQTPAAGQPTVSQKVLERLKAASPNINKLWAAITITKTDTGNVSDADVERFLNVLQNMPGGLTDAQLAGILQKVKPGNDSVTDFLAALEKKFPPPTGGGGTGDASKPADGQGDAPGTAKVKPGGEKEDGEGEGKGKGTGSGQLTPESKDEDTIVAADPSQKYKSATGSSVREASKDVASFTEFTFTITPQEAIKKKKEGDTLMISLVAKGKGIYYSKLVKVEIISMEVFVPEKKGDPVIYNFTLDLKDPLSVQIKNDKNELVKELQQLNYTYSEKTVKLP